MSNANRLSAAAPGSLELRVLVIPVPVLIEQLLDGQDLP